MNEHKYRKNILINYQLDMIDFFYYIEMASLLDNNIDDTHAEDNGLMGKIKEFKKNHSILFWVIIVSVVIALIGIIVVVVYIVNKKKREKEEENKEGFAASNDINDEFDYVNSVIYSTLGDVSELEKINKNAVSV